MVFLQVQIKIMATGCDEEQGEQNQLLSLHHSPPRDWWRLSISYWTNIGFELQHFQYWFKAAEKGVKEEGLLSYWLKKTWNMNYFIVAMEIGWVKQFEIKSMKVLLSLPTCCMGWGFFSSNQHEARGEATLWTSSQSACTLFTHRASCKHQHLHPRAGIQKYSGFP